jgi:hypothetical protein
VDGRLKAALAVCLLLVPGLLLVTFVVGLGNPDQAGPPTGSYSVEYTGRALVVTQETGRVTSGTLVVTYDGARQVWVAPNGTGYDNGGRGHPVQPGDQFVFSADVSPGDPVGVLWRGTDGERTTLANLTVGEPKTPSARVRSDPIRSALVRSDPSQPTSVRPVIDPSSSWPTNSAALTR